MIHTTTRMERKQISDKNEQTETNLNQFTKFKVYRLQCKATVCIPDNTFVA